MEIAVMKRFAQVIVIAGAALIGAAGMAAAQGVGVDVGPNGLYVGVTPQRDHRDHDWRHDYNRARDCHWVSHRHWSHHQHGWIVKRERVCD
jgi:hypothetical protein